MLQQLEQPIHPQQKKQVLEAIHAGGLKVSPTAIAEAAGLPILVVAQELNQIATETGAHLEVTAGGSVNYVFPPQFEQAYALRGPKNFFRNCLRVVVNCLIVTIRTLVFVGTFLLRISFGLLLLLSVVALVVIVIAAIVAAMSGDNGGGGGGDSGGGGLDLGLSADGLGDGFASQWSLNFWCFDWLWDWVFFPRYMWGYPYGYYGYSYFGDPYDPRWDPFGTGTTYSSEPRNSSIEQNAIASGTEKTKQPRTKFLDSCFALLFGADDPNKGLIQRQWNDITRTIRTNHGVVVAEQLSPYLHGNKDNEDWMLPILLRLNGLPDVSESGNIIYMFPAFMNLPSEQHQQDSPEINTQAKPSPSSPSSPSAASAASAASSPSAASTDADQLRALYTGHLKRQKVINQNVQKRSDLEPFLQEQPLTLLPEDGEYESVFLFVGLAIALSAGCLYYSNSVTLLHNFRPLFYGVLSYSSLFFIFPAIRHVINIFTNEKIEERNNKRMEASAQVQSPSAQTEQKLQEARVIAISSMNEDNNKIVYTTTEDLLEQAATQSEKLT
jgi:hypothetical protein